jgi:predicted ferric reductase
MDINATPWPWYIARAAGLIGFVFLWLTIFLGLAIRNPLLKKIVQPIYSFDFHCFTAAMAVFLALVHGTALLFDSSIGFGIKDVTVPFYNNSEFLNTNYLALGIIAFYAMLIMTITSYLRAHISHWFWRVLHFLNPLAFIFVVFHGINNGTDMHNVYVRDIFMGSSFLLVIIYLSSLIFALWRRYSAPSAEEILRRS